MEVKLRPQVSIAIGQLSFDRETKNRILNQLYGQLENNHRYWRRQHPNPEHLDDEFFYRHSLYVNRRWTTLYFTVTDRFQGVLLVVEMTPDPPHRT